MQITESSQGAWTILQLAGKIDSEGSNELGRKLMPLMNGGAVALNFSGVEYITSVGFRTLLTALREQTAKKGRLVVGNMPEAVRAYFDVAGLSPVFKVASDIQPIVSQAP